MVVNELVDFARIGAWVLVVAAIWRQAGPHAGTEAPTHALEKAYRLADRTAARLKVDRFVRTAPPNSRRAPMATVSTRRSRMYG